MKEVIEYKMPSIAAVERTQRQNFTGYFAMQMEENNKEIKNFYEQKDQHSKMRRNKLMLEHIIVSRERMASACV